MLKKIISILLWSLLIIPLLLLAQWVHPANDDYGYYMRVQQYGFLAHQIRYYYEWSGRYTATLLIPTFLLDGSLTEYRLLPFFWLACLVGGFLYFLKTVKSWNDRTDRLIAAALFLFVFFDRTINLSETLYWGTGVVHYVFSVPGILVIWSALRESQTSVQKSLLLALLAIFLVGLSEFTALLLAFSLGLSFLDAFYFTGSERKHRLRNIVVIGIATLAATLVSFLAPGNFARATVFENRYNMPHAIDGTIQVWLYLIKQWFYRSPLLPLSVLYIIYLSRLKPSNITFLLQGKARWLLPLAMPTVLLLAVFPVFYSTGGPPPGRVANATFFLFLIFWFASLQLFAPYYKKVRPSILWTIFFALMLHTRWTGGNYAQGVIPDLSGRAAAYDEEMEYRYRLIRSSNDPDVVVPPLKNRPPTIFFEDIVSDPEDPRNQGQAGYFGKRSLRTAE